MYPTVLQELIRELISWKQFWVVQGFAEPLKQGKKIYDFDYVHYGAVTTIYGAVTTISRTIELNFRVWKLLQTFCSSQLEGFCKILYQNEGKGVSCLKTRSKKLHTKAHQEGSIKWKGV